MRHKDTWKSDTGWNGDNMWCVNALKKVGNRYVYRSRADCPYTQKFGIDNPCGMRHKH